MPISLGSGLAGVSTSDGYSSAATLGPLPNLTTVSFTVANESVFCQIYQLDRLGILHLDPYEIPLPPGIWGFDSLQGIRFRSAIAGKPAVVVCTGYFRSDAVPFGNPYPFPGALTPDGSYTPPSSGLPPSKTSAYFAAVMADSPAGFWPLDDETPPFLDYSGNGLNLSILGSGAALQTQGKDGDIVAGDFLPYYSLLNFYANVNGPSEGIVLTPFPNLVNNFAIELWLLQVNQPATHAPIIANQSAGRGYQIELTGTPSKIAVTCQGIAVIGGGGSAIPSAWTYLCVQRVAGTWQSYINGGTLDQNIGVTTPNLPGAGSTFAIGNGQFSGYQAFVAVYTHTLTPARIQAHYDAMPPRT